MSNVRSEIREYLLSEFLLGEPSEKLKDTTPLVSGGVLDSIGTIKLVDHLETTYDVQFQAHELTVDNLETIDKIVEIVNTKLAS